jgi:alpha-beta hydrolase superfamily lysophospholipase
VDFAPLLHERGHTVLVVRMPYNGFADRGTDALKNITAEGLAAFGDDVVDVAEGLGEEVIFLGISAGGTIAGWAAQNRAEVDRGVLVAPFYGLGRLGPRVNLALMRAMLVLPNVSLWKDPALRERWDGMAHAYARQSSRATAEIIRLGLGTYRQADEWAAEAREIVVITNEADTAVSNATTDAVVAAWREQGVPLTTYAFPARHGLGHELIDPEEPGADPALTYPVILQLLEDPDAFDPDALPAVGGGPSAAPASAGASSP